MIIFSKTTFTCILASIILSGSGAAAQSSALAKETAEATIAKVRAEKAPDGRQIVYDIKAYTAPDGTLIIAGNTSEANVHEALKVALDATGVDYADSVKVFPTDQWAQVRIPVASLRTGGRHAAEMATQAIMGTPLRVLEKGAEWWRVQTPDGYIAYVPSSSVVAKTPGQMADWRASRRFIVSSPYQIRAFSTATADGLRDVVTDLVNGCIVTASTSVPTVENGRVEVVLPDGRKGWVAVDEIVPIEQWASQEFDADKILDIAYSMMGTPYLWGGTSTKALDCSGLAKVSYFANGIILMRDASQQALTGTRIEARDWRNCRAGDLLFFGNADTGRVTHVAIYDNNGDYVHSSGRVRRNSVDPESDIYLTTPFLHAVRIAGNEETPGITRARNHPWYF